MSPEEKQMADMLEKLRADYSASLPGKLERIEALWSDLVAGRAELTQLEDLLRMAHTIAGSGATFGQPAVSQAARELELFLAPHCRNGALPDTQGRGTVVRLVQSLRAAVAT
jgi:HPt (histidine-containing phosphotransfer) domain-containing protein